MFIIHLVSCHSVPRGGLMRRCDTLSRQYEAFQTRCTAIVLVNFLVHARWAQVITRISIVPMVPYTVLSTLDCCAREEARW
jgi:hypothetical protein